MFKTFSKFSIVSFLLLFIGTLSYFFFIGYMESVEVDLALSMVNSSSDDEFDKLSALNNVENFIFISLIILSCLSIFSLINDYTKFKKRN